MAIARVQAVAGVPFHINFTAAATLGLAPTAGNLVVGVLFNDSNGAGAPRPTPDFTGWSVIHNLVGPDPVDAVGNDLTNVIVAMRTVRPGDTATYTLPCTGVAWQDGSLSLLEYSGLGVNPTVDVKNDGGEQVGLQTINLPVITPVAGKERLILAAVNLTPNYDPAVPGAWTRVLDDTAAGNRQTMQILEKIIASTAGSYGGDAMGPVGFPSETSWWNPITALGGGAGSLVIGGTPGGGIL